MVLWRLRLGLLTQPDKRFHEGTERLGQGCPPVHALESAAFVRREIQLLALSCIRSTYHSMVCHIPGGCIEVEVAPEGRHFVASPLDQRFQIDLRIAQPSRREYFNRHWPSHSGE